MTVYEFIKDNRSLTRSLSGAGLLKFKVETYYAIYSRYLFYFSTGSIKTHAIRKACIDFHTCEKTGWLVIKEMETTI